VLIRDLSDYRLDIARQCGIGDTSNARTESMADAGKRVFGDEGYSVAFEAVGAEATMADTVDTIEKGGTIMVVGVFGEKPRIDMSIVGDRAVELIASGEVITDPLVTRHFPLEQYEDAYSYIDDQGDKTLKVMIDL
jgi:threonine dehydrogenase-like Zn-dependent dehydrogenase